ncbi:MAG: hypothetical protein KGY78_10850 [Anaerolineae bacterium]|nr:hypothetical protein [Anaerolineae bacterium]
MTKLDGQTHHPECWEYHHDCAKRVIGDLLDTLDEIAHGIVDPVAAAKGVLRRYTIAWAERDLTDTADYIAREPENWLLGLQKGDTVTVFYGDGALVTGEIADIGDDSLGITQDHEVYTVIPRNMHVMMIRRVEEE